MGEIRNHGICQPLNSLDMSAQSLGGMERMRMRRATSAHGKAPISSHWQSRHRGLESGLHQQSPSICTCTCTSTCTSNLILISPQPQAFSHFLRFLIAIRAPDKHYITFNKHKQFSFRFIEPAILPLRNRFAPTITRPSIQDQLFLISPDHHVSRVGPRRARLPP